MCTWYAPHGLAQFAVTGAHCPLPRRATTHDALTEQLATLRKVSSGKSSRAGVRGRVAGVQAGDEGILELAPRR